MKKFFLLLTALFLATSLNAMTSKDRIAIFHMVAEDLSNIDISNTKCEQAIIDFYAIVAKKGEQNAKVIKDYKDCMAEKQNKEMIIEARK